MIGPCFSALSALPALWDVLADEPRDIWLYGMGNGADKILAVLRKRDIPVKGVFASDGFVRGQVFHDMPVRSFSEVCARYPQDGCVVLLAFGSARPEVLSLVSDVAARYPLFVPDVPVCGEDLFDKSYFLSHRDELAAARGHLADEASKRLFDLALAYKITGRLDLLLAAVSQTDAARDILSLDTVSHMVDLGAYNGDTVREMMEIAPLKTVIAAEPDRRNFKKLSAWAAHLSTPAVSCHRVAISDTVGLSPFDASGNRNAGLSTGRESSASTVCTTTVDALVGSAPVDYIKYDIEGAEALALQGSRATIAGCAPRLRIACYHRSEDLFTLPLLLNRIAPDYSMYLTRARSLPLWDLDLLATPRTKM